MKNPNVWMLSVAAVLAQALAAWPVCFAEEKQPPASFELKSAAFVDGATIPDKYTCAGADINPPLEMVNVPSKAKTLALTVHDADAPEGEWVHWVLYNVRTDKAVIAENSTTGDQALTDFGKYNYAGPCPTNDKSHRYLFQAYALDTVLNLNEGITMKDLERAMRGHIIAKSVLTGTYQKSMW